MIASTLTLIALAQAGASQPASVQRVQLSTQQKLSRLNEAAKRQGISRTFKSFGASKVLTVRNGFTEENGVLKFGGQCQVVDYKNNWAEFPAGAAQYPETGFQLFFSSKAPSSFYMVKIEAQGTGNVVFNAVSNRTTSGGNSTTNYTQTFPYGGTDHFIFVVQTYEASSYRVDVHANVPWKFLTAEVSRVD